MVSSSIVVLFLLTLIPGLYAHCGPTPALGVTGTFQRSDVKRPSQNNPCGDNVDIAGSLDKSTSVLANPDGVFKVTVQDFNGGKDGSRKIQTAKVDPTGKGNNFNPAVTITTNGDPSPNGPGQETVTAKLPPGTKCTGGASKNKCLIQMVTTAGFGNCVVVRQGRRVARRSRNMDYREETPAAAIQRGEDPPAASIKRGEDAPAGAIRRGEDPPAASIKRGEDAPAGAIRRGEDPPAASIKRGEDAPAAAIRRGEDAPAAVIKRYRTQMESREETSDIAGRYVVFDDPEGTKRKGSRRMFFFSW